MEKWPLAERVIPFDETDPKILADAFAFARVLQGAVGMCTGIIIVAYRDGKREPECYRGQLGDILDFEEGSTEDPRLYRTPKGLLRGLKTNRDEMNSWLEPPEVVHAALWVHPDYYAMPRAKYVDMKGRFPGSPRR